MVIIRCLVIREGEVPRPSRMFPVLLSKKFFIQGREVPAVAGSGYDSCWILEKLSQMIVRLVVDVYPMILVQDAWDGQEGQNFG